MGNKCSGVPWRTPHAGFKWTHEFNEKLIEEIQNIPTFEPIIPNILLVGPTSAGKSSLVNTCLSTGADDLVQKAETGSADQSLTKTLTRYAGVGKFKNKYRLCDTAGILTDANEHRGLRRNDIQKVMMGHVDSGYKFLDKNDISEDNEKYVRNPEDKSKVHCLVIVIASDTIAELSSTYRIKVKEAIVSAQEIGIPVLIVLTKIDRLCYYVNEDRKKIFTCHHVKKIVTITSEKFGIPEGSIFPMFTYSPQVAKVEAPEIDTLGLLTLRKMLQSASYYLEGPDCL